MQNIQQTKHTTRILWAFMLMGQGMLFFIARKHGSNQEVLPPLDLYIYTAVINALLALRVKFAINSESFLKKAVAKNPNLLGTLFLMTIVTLTLSESVTLLGFVQAPRNWEVAKVHMILGVALMAYMFPTFATAEALLKKTSGSLK